MNRNVYIMRLPYLPNIASRGGQAKGIGEGDIVSFEPIIRFFPCVEKIPPRVYVSYTCARIADGGLGGLGPSTVASDCASSSAYNTDYS